MAKAVKEVVRLLVWFFLFIVPVDRLVLAEIYRFPYSVIRSSC
ncbi:MAG TPA: hypothetical protein VGK42_07965 [Candidatus Dormibacteraeota bacterium]